MSSLKWKLEEDDAPGVAYLTLPVPNAIAQALLRGVEPSVRLSAYVNPDGPGRFADIMVLGFPSLYALSLRLSAAVSQFVGVALHEIDIEGGPGGYKLLGVTGRCGAVDYRKSKVVDRMGSFVRLRGLHVDQPEVAGDFAVPTDRETVLVTAEVAERLGGVGFQNLRFTSMADSEFHVPQEMLG